ncbi:MAG: hypothetical protein WAZ18_04675 [Alphaproteobacteria bacterium]
MMSTEACKAELKPTPNMTCQEQVITINGKDVTFVTLKPAVVAPVATPRPTVAVKADTMPSPSPAVVNKDPQLKVWHTTTQPEPVARTFAQRGQCHTYLLTQPTTPEAMLGCYQTAGRSSPFGIIRMADVNPGNPVIPELSFVEDGKVYYATPRLCMQASGDQPEFTNMSPEYYLKCEGYPYNNPVSGVHATVYSPVSLRVNQPVPPPAPLYNDSYYGGSGGSTSGGRSWSYESGHSAGTYWPWAVKREKVAVRRTHPHHRSNHVDWHVKRDTPTNPDRPGYPGYPERKSGTVTVTPNTLIKPSGNDRPQYNGTTVTITPNHQPTHPHNGQPRYRGQGHGGVMVTPRGHNGTANSPVGGHGSFRGPSSKPSVQHQPRSATPPAAVVRAAPSAPPAPPAPRGGGDRRR